MNSYNVVIVDDEALIRNLIKMKLNCVELNLNIVGEFSDALSLLTKVNELKPDIILSDICMPGLDGISFSETCTKMLPDVKIILITGFNDFEFARRSIKAGVFDYLMKPVQSEELNSAVSRAIGEIYEARQSRKKVDELKAQMESIVSSFTKDNISNSVREFAVDVKECIEAGEIAEFRDRVLAYVKSDESKDHTEFVAWVRNIVMALRDEMFPNVKNDIPESLGKIYKNEKEVYYWLESQLNELLACGSFRHNDNRLVGQVYRYAADNIEDPDVNLNSISGHFSISNSHLSRLFKKQVGKNYVEIMSDMRLARMIELLNTTSMKDRDIGEHIGIFDPHYLSIWFKKVTGLSPSEYRKKY